MYVWLHDWFILLTVASASISFVWVEFSHFCHTWHGFNAMLRGISCSLREAGGTFGHSSPILSRRWSGQRLDVWNKFASYRTTTSQTPLLHISSPTLARIHFTIFFFFLLHYKHGLGKSLATFSLLRKLIIEFWRYLLKVAAKQIYLIWKWERLRFYLFYQIYITLKLVKEMPNIENLNLS